MKTISIRDLHLNTGRWVRKAARRDRVIITDRGRPVATLSAYDSSTLGRPLPNREKRIRKRSRIRIDSAVYVSGMRDGD